MSKIAVATAGILLASLVSGAAMPLLPPGPAATEAALIQVKAKKETRKTTRKGDKGMKGMGGMKHDMKGMKGM